MQKAIRPAVGAWVAACSILIILIHGSAISAGAASLEISNLRVGTPQLDKQGISIPLTVDFKSPDGPPASALWFVQFQGDKKATGHACSADNTDRSATSGTLNCTWADPKFKPRKAVKKLPFRLLLFLVSGESSNTLEGAIDFP